MDQNDRLPEIIDYLKANPTVPGPGAGGQHVHIHYHAAPPAAPPAEPRGPTVAEQVVPWVLLALGTCIILTICALFLAVVVVALVLGLLALAVAVAVVAYLIKTINEGKAAAAASARPTRRTK